MRVTEKDYFNFLFKADLDYLPKGYIQEVRHDMFRDMCDVFDTPELQHHGFGTKFDVESNEGLVFTYYDKLLFKQNTSDYYNIFETIMNNPSHLIMELEKLARKRGYLP